MDWSSVAGLAATARCAPGGQDQVGGPGRPGRWGQCIFRRDIVAQINDWRRCWRGGSGDLQIAGHYRLSKPVWFAGACLFPGRGNGFPGIRRWIWDLDRIFLDAFQEMGDGCL